MNLSKWPNELDYLTVMGYLSDYRFKRDKLTKLMSAGDLVRIKKGIYVLGEAWRKGPYSRELLANMIYGPSYVSLDYALSHYGLIPEKTETVTSVTSGRNKTFQTPAGRFSYRYLRRAYYAAGIDREDTGGGKGYLIASPEKAVIDKVTFDSGATTLNELKDDLFHSWRMEKSDLKRLDLKKLVRIAKLHEEKPVILLVQLAKDLS